MILQRHRRTEHRHDAVTGELVHRAAVPLHHGRAAVDEIGHDLAEPLRTHRRSDIHGVHHIGEQDGYLLVLRADVMLRHRCTAAVTESSPRPRFSATVTARGRCGHPILR